MDVIALLTGRRGRPDAAALGPRQRALLRLLLEHKGGRTADELADALGVSRSAVHQHLAGLLSDGFVARVDLKKTGGRPGHAFALTVEGEHLFPKRYDWFSGFLMAALSKRLTSDQLTEELRGVGADLAAPMQPAFAGKPRAEQIKAAADLMSDLGYAARPSTDDPAHEIEAFNCIYHHLAAERPEVCEIDLAFLETLFGERPDHAECMVRGGKACRFRLKRSDPS